MKQFRMKHARLTKMAGGAKNGEVLDLVMEERLLPAERVGTLETVSVALTLTGSRAAMAEALMKVGECYDVWFVARAVALECDPRAGWITVCSPVKIEKHGERIV